MLKHANIYQMVMNSVKLMKAGQIHETRHILRRLKYFIPVAIAERVFLKMQTKQHRFFLKQKKA